MGFQLLLELKTLLLAFLVPVVLLSVLYTIDGNPGKCAYGILVLVGFWMFEVFPLPVTSLLSSLIFPCLGVLTAKEVASAFIADVSLTVISIFGIVAAVQKWNLHRRGALGILMLFGTKPHLLILGILVCSAVLSMFITAGVVVLMIPIVTDLAEKSKTFHLTTEETLDQTEIIENPKAVNEESVDSTYSGSQENGNSDSMVHVKLTGANLADRREATQLAKALFLSVAYGATLGSSGLLPASPANLVMLDLSDKFYQEYGLKSNVTFISWLVFGLPIVVIMVFATWIWFVILFLGGRGIFRRSKTTGKMLEAEAHMKEHLRDEYRKLGPWSYPEMVVLIILVMMILLFITKDLYFVPGWDSIFKDRYLGASAPASLMLALLFLIPAKSPRELLCGREKSNEKDDPKASRFAGLLTWWEMQSSIPWGVILLLGAAFTMVKASRASGLVALLEVQLSAFEDIEPWVLTIVVTVMTTFLTEVMSNAATVALLLPIMGQLAIVANVDPLALIFPMTLAAKCAFMMPISTPPNAIVYSVGILRVKDMAVAGFVLNIIALLAVNVGAQTWGKAYFQWDVLNDAFRTNITLTQNSTLLPDS